MPAVIGLALTPIHVFMVASSRDIGYTLSCVLFVEPIRGSTVDCCHATKVSRPEAPTMEGKGWGMP